MTFRSTLFYRPWRSLIGLIPGFLGSLAVLIYLIVAGVTVVVLYIVVILVLLTFLLFTFLAIGEIVRKNKKKKDLTMLSKEDKPPKPDSIRPTLLDEQDDEVKAMVERGDKESVNLLCNRVLDGNDNEQMVALWALGQIGDHRAIPTVRQALNDPNEYVRRRAEQVLEMLEKQIESGSKVYFCAECGFENPLKAVFCRECGHKIS
ncbi:MAG: hypothetical protein GPJ51_12445 [Candidatus Heimdallarchaeota archaeon]|nr:hypothetical protein [Candidatus Heimdallarchaeota archaeon]